jgi:hypothetical protein
LACFLENKVMPIDHTEVDCYQQGRSAGRTLGEESYHYDKEKHLKSVHGVLLQKCFLKEIKT